MRALVFPVPVAFDRVFRYAKLEYNEKRFDYVGAAKEYKFIISKENKDFFGFDEEKTITDNDISNKPTHFLKYTNLYVHVDQIKNDKNYYNGSPSDIIHKNIVGNDAFGDIVTWTYPHPLYYKLNTTTINQFRVYVTDEFNELVDFHDQPISYVFEIK